MKVLQTLGVHGSTGQAGIFQYRRTAQGIEIDSSIGFSSTGGRTIILHQSWINLLITFSQQNSVWDLSSLRTYIQNYLSVDGSTASAVAAILEHEGSMDLYGGVVGVGQGVSIHLQRDY
ncbi:hypothetical protein [Dickeya parazeae]|uniref:hypothetical protein n=1 Tax=Dickeya parazeae TaxID=2893572 RepID=UPI001AECDB75|nr:hypothetical protein [Dickeya parazeae]MBP2835687.1 hypothetical protein [Dickeya parazeae]